MKTRMKLPGICLLSISWIACFSQKDGTGIYLTASDFVNHKITLLCDCKKPGASRVKTDMLFHPNQVSIKHNGIIYIYPKDSIYAIKYCDGSIVRIYETDEYQLLNPGEAILIYKASLPASAKELTTLITRYYFSKDAMGKIYELTIKNLKTAYLGNEKFNNSLQAGFQTDNELSAYDRSHKMMKISWLLNRSLASR